MDTEITIVYHRPSVRGRGLCEEKKISFRIELADRKAERDSQRALAEAAR